MTLPARKMGGGGRAPIALHDRAMDDLRFIRETMERSGSFTHVSGSGGIAMGVVALLAALLARETVSAVGWIGVWLGAATVSFGLAGGLMARKSRSAGVSLLTGPGRKFMWSMIPALMAGGILTLALSTTGAVHLLPGVWLLLYGTAVITGGSHSVRPVPLMGLAFMVLGTAALFSPPGWRDGFMALGFGGLHIVFGAVIWRKYGG
ncbi:MAG: hypothetical protein R3304_09490 [Longimicrobiales bacterium]|nr:hypothetical protein [Longimicrobiales bacterium]